MKHIVRHILLCICLILCLFSNIACGLKKKPVYTPQAKVVLYQWYDYDNGKPVSVHINLDQQIATYKRGSQEIGWSFVATGKEGHSTPTGQYRVLEKQVDKYSNIYGWMEDQFGNVTNGDAKATDKPLAGERYVAAPMPYWMRLTNYGIGMHAGLIPKPGETASHGCIRLPHDFVPQLFEVVKVGTPVIITHSGF
jgi:lipoprotein-anchoring transpeptidase ErfK/SrfK